MKKYALFSGLTALFWLLAASPVPAIDTVTVESVAADPSAALLDIRWQLVEINGLAVEPAGAGREAHLVFQEQESRFGGYGGCNKFGGGYEVSGERLRFHSIRSTRMACPDTMELEARFMRALGQVAAWKIENDQLRVFSEDGTLLAVFDSSPLPPE